MSRVRSFRLFAPYRAPGFVSLFEDTDGVVGRRFFEEWAARNDAVLVPGGGRAGIVPDLGELASDDFRPERVDPRVRATYEHTSGVDFQAGRPEWGSLGWLWHFVYYTLVARGMRQLNAPVAKGLLPGTLKSTVSYLDVDRDGRADYRVWVRVYEESDQIFYVGAVRHYVKDGPSGTQSYLAVALPLFFSNLAVAFRVGNTPNGGLSLRTRQPGSYDAGMYLVLPGRRSFSMIPALGMNEDITVEPAGSKADDAIRGTHRNRWLSIPTYTIPYSIRTGTIPAAAGEGDERA